MNLKVNNPSKLVIQYFFLTVNLRQQSTRMLDNNRKTTATSSSQKRDRNGYGFIKEHTNSVKIKCDII
jgi:uncharacterized protein YpiB (UPF0302 family)